MSFLHSPRYSQRNSTFFSSSPHREVVVPSPTHHPLNRTFPGTSPSSSPSASTFSQPISIPNRRLLFNGEDPYGDNGEFIQLASPTIAINNRHPPNNTHLQPQQKQYLMRQHSTDVIYENEVNKFSNNTSSSENVGFSFEFQLDEEIRERYHSHYTHNLHSESPIRHPARRPLSAHLSPQHQHLHYHGEPLGWRAHSEPVPMTGRHTVYASSSPVTSSGNLMHAHSWERRTRSCSDPTAPPLYTLEDYAGYELTTAFKSVCMIPPYQGHEPPPPYDDEDYRTTNQLNKRRITDDDAVEAFANYLSESCCYGTNINKLKDRVKIKDIRPGNSHRYMLETFYEERTTIWHQEPYTNQIIDGTENGPPPRAWDIDVMEPPMFQPRETHVEVPHTASIKDCPNCFAKGRRQCSPCHGHGNTKCTICDGLGILQNFSPDRLTFERRSSSTAASRSCPHCNNGQSECKRCHGKGRVTCTTCKGEGALKVSIRLAVKWKILKDHKVQEGSQIPNKYIEKVSGTLVFHEQNDRVYPLADFPENEMNDLSAKFIKRHKEQLEHAQIKMQRHFVREVPVAKIKSEWEKKEFVYWIYGDEKYVYCPENPTKCFNKCSLM